MPTYLDLATLSFKVPLMSAAEATASVQNNRTSDRIIAASVIGVLLLQKINVRALAASVKDSFTFCRVDAGLSAGASAARYS